MYENVPTCSIGRFHSRDWRIENLKSNKLSEASRAEFFDEVFFHFFITSVEAQMEGYSTHWLVRKGQYGIASGKKSSRRAQVHI